MMLLSVSISKNIELSSSSKKYCPLLLLIVNDCVVYFPPDAVPLIAESNDSSVVRDCCMAAVSLMLDIIGRPADNTTPTADITVPVIKT